MSLRYKIALFYLVGFFGMTVAFTFSYTWITEDQIRSQFFERQQLALKQIGSNLVELEKTVDGLNQSAVEYLYLNVKLRGLPDTDELKALAKKVGVAHFYITNNQGKFIRSTETPIEEIGDKGLFDFCPGYRNLLIDSNSFETTPILPSHPYGRAYKFLMRASHDGKYILESGIHLTYIASILESTLKNESALLDVGIYTPSGFMLGQISRSSGELASQSRELPDDLSVRQIEPDGRVRIFQQVEASTQNCCECEIKKVTQSDGGNYYYVIGALVDTHHLNQEILAARWKVVRIGLTAFLAFSLVGLILARGLSGRFLSLDTQIHKIIETGDFSRRIADSGKDEIGKIVSNINGLLDGIERSNARLVNAERSENLARIARQVAHDIRSPLAALDMVLKISSEIPEERRVMVRTAIGRIRDIANNLVKQYQTQRPSTTGQIENTESPIGQTNPSTVGAVHAHQSLAGLREGQFLSDTEKHTQIDAELDIEMLSSVLESIISEKRLQYRSRVGVEIDLDLGEGTYGLFARISSRELKRILSNLVNNSVEAAQVLPSTAADGATAKAPIRVHVRLEQLHGRALISIQDNGRGIAPDLIPQLGQAGNSFGKTDAESGAGLGLFHAKTTLQQWGGSLEIESTQGVGTTVKMMLQAAPAPTWFLPELDLRAVKDVVVLDDDQSIHEVWKQRLTDSTCRLIHFQGADEFSAYVGSLSPSQVGRTLFLCDQELIGSRFTGLELIEAHGLGARSVLVSSQYEEPQVKSLAEKLGVRLLPKGLASLVPIRVA